MALKNVIILSFESLCCHLVQYEDDTGIEATLYFTWNLV